jgi:hypothetical protein
MDVTSYIIKEGPCRGSECPGIKPIGNGEGQFFLSTDFCAFSMLSVEAAITLMLLLS